MVSLKNANENDKSFSHIVSKIFGEEVSHD